MDIFYFDRKRDLFQGFYVYIYLYFFSLKNDFDFKFNYFKWEINRNLIRVLKYSNIYIIYGNYGRYYDMSDQRLGLCLKCFS